MPITYSKAQKYRTRILNSRKRRCEICGEVGEAICSGYGDEWVFINGKLCLDHDHKTGLFRGVLCNRCNSRLVDDFEWLKKAMVYLEKTINGVELPEVKEDYPSTSSSSPTPSSSGRGLPVPTPSSHSQSHCEQGRGIPLERYIRLTSHLLFLRYCVQIRCRW